MGWVSESGGFVSTVARRVHRLDRVRRGGPRRHTDDPWCVSGATTSFRGRVGTVDRTEIFVAERPRLVGLATRVLADPAEAEDVVQQAWLRLHSAEGDIDSLPAWLTTVTTRLCLDRLRARRSVPVPEVEVVIIDNPDLPTLGMGE